MLCLLTSLSSSPSAHLPRTSQSAVAFAASSFSKHATGSRMPCECLHNARGFVNPGLFRFWSGALPHRRQETERLATPKATIQRGDDGADGLPGSKKNPANSIGVF